MFCCRLLTSFKLNLFQNKKKSGILSNCQTDQKNSLDTNQDLDSVGPDLGPN